MALSKTITRINPTIPSMTSSTTLDDAAAYMLEMATNIATALGLVVLSELTSSTSVNSLRYFIGDEVERAPIFCLCNNSSSSYWYRYWYLGIVATNGAPYYVPSGNSSNDSVSNGYIYVNPLVACDIRVVKNSNATMFTVCTSSTSIPSVMKGFVQSVSNNTEQCKLGVLFSSSAIAYTAIPLLISGVSAWGNYDSLLRCVPSDREAYFNICLPNLINLEHIKLLTNKVGAHVLSTVNIGTTNNWLVVYTGTNVMTVILELD